MNEINDAIERLRYISDFFETRGLQSFKFFEPAKSSLIQKEKKEQFNYRYKIIGFEKLNGKILFNVLNCKFAGDKSYDGYCRIVMRVKKLSYEEILALLEGGDNGSGNINVSKKFLDDNADFDERVLDNFVLNPEGKEEIKAKPKYKNKRVERVKEVDVFKFDEVRRLDI